MAASPDLCLVRKMFADNRTFSRDVVSSIIKSTWRSRSLYSIYPWENNHFIFTFSEEQDAQRILHDSPWLVKGHCLILQPWNPNVHISEIDFSHEMFWVQAHGLPFGKLTRAYATELAPKVGALVDVDCDAEGSQLDNLVEVPVKVMSIDDASDSNVGVVAAPDQPHAPCTRAFPNILACVESVVSNNTNFSLESPVTNYEIHKAVKELGALKAPGIKAMGLEVGSIRRIQGIGYGVLEFLGVGTTFDIFQIIHILYLEYDILSYSGYGVLSFIPLWSLVSAGTDTPYLP
ncbi:retrotransposon protein, putative, unclassified [Tanacetum coccineum]